ncbi:MAG: S9 family peptidase [Xanthomonadales bacterium]|nr:S9 family peptidase [Xanthomonadales bacterium]
MLLPWLAPGVCAETLDPVPERREANGQLVLQGIPQIPPGLGKSLARFHDVRSSLFAGWTPDGGAVYVKTRSDGVNQIHRVDRAGGSHRQITERREPIGEVARQPVGELIAYSMDVGGSGYDQIYLLDPATGESRQLTHGQALNNRMAWDHQGRRLAYRSTRRNGRSNDIWIMDIEAPGEARLVFAAPDGAFWKPVDFSRHGEALLLQYYAGITDSRIYLLDLATDALRLLAGSADQPTSNVATGFNHDDSGVLFVTNQRGEAAEIAELPLDPAGSVRYMQEAVTWDITEFRLSEDRRRGAFVTNEEGISRLYLFDPLTMAFERVRRLPVGVISSLEFSPAGRKLGMTLNTPRTPSDVFVLGLRPKPLSHKRLVRWTYGTASGLDPDRFIDPDLVHYPAPMITDTRTMLVPAFVYLPRGRGPFPVIIYIHGGPEGQFRPSFNSTIQMWLDRLGVAVIAPNVRGSLGYGTHYLQMDDGRQREHSVMDIGALLDWIAAHDQFDADRVGVYGASYGGYMALASTVHFGDRISAAVARAGISNFVTYLENTQDYRRDLRRVEYGDERDPEMRAFLQSISPLNNVDRITTPLFIVQGENDPVVPASESAQMVNALRQRGLPVWYMNALNEGHSYEHKRNRDLFQQVTVMFFEEFLLRRRGKDD